MTAWDQSASGVNGPSRTTGREARRVVDLGLDRLGSNGGQGMPVTPSCDPTCFCLSLKPKRSPRWPHTNFTKPHPSRFGHLKPLSPPNIFPLDYVTVGERKRWLLRWKADTPRTPGRKKPAIKNEASFVKRKRGAYRGCVARMNAHHINSRPRRECFCAKGWYPRLRC
jgi:hypothetical protein